jgi:SAM-dependent methyltransferase
VSPLSEHKISLASAVRSWWSEERARSGSAETLHKLGAIAAEFVRDSLPDRKRQRFGDVDFDWEYRVDTTAANVSWRNRFIGLLHSSYQPIEPEFFRGLLDALHTDFSEFTFIDIGSGKGRALLLAAEYPFRRVVGVELLPELNEIAQENIAKFQSPRRRCLAVESVGCDATGYEFPNEPLVVYFFHPLLEAGFRKVLANLHRSMRAAPRPVRVIYANPIFDGLVQDCPELQKMGGTHQYSLFCEREERVRAS